MKFTRDHEYAWKASKGDLHYAIEKEDVGHYDVWHAKGSPEMGDHWSIIYSASNYRRAEQYAKDHAEKAHAHE